MWETFISKPAELCLDKAWLFYQQGHGYGSRLSMVTEHQVVGNAQGRPMIGPGQAIEPASAAKAFAAMQGEKVLEHTHSGLLPANVLQFDQTKLTWWVRGRRRPMWLVRYQGSKNITIKLVVPWPSLVFHVSKKRGLQIFAIRGYRRPGAQSRLYHAPLGNVYDSGVVCLGNAEPGGLGLESIPVWEEAIFDTRFAHINHRHTLTAEACGLKRDDISESAHRKFWRKLHKQCAERFPAEALREFVNPGTGRVARLAQVLP